MKITKTKSIETRLNPAAARVSFYRADAASDPPDHARVQVHIPGTPEGLDFDVALSDEQDRTIMPILKIIVDSVLKDAGYIK